MYKLIRFYNQNRKKILKIILIIVFIIGIIQLLNYFAKNNKGNDINKNNTINENTNIRQEVISNKSAVSGDTVSNIKLNNDTEVINQFVKYCNEQNINAAYELLSSDCKQEMFPALIDFNNIYYSKLFNGDKKTYTVENWSGSIYQVRFTGDILSTGDLTNNETKQDYITIVRENGENKLNINNYIGKQTSSRATEYKDIKISVTSIDTYMDYEIYNLSIQNNSENDILLDTSDDTKSVYLLDSKNMKYYFYSNEIIQNKLLIESKFTRSIQIKFTNSYSSSRNIKKLVFSKLVLNYDEYKNLEDKQEYQDFYEFRVDV